MEKKGQVRREVVLWVVALLTLVVFSVFIFFLYEGVPNLVNKETCRFSVLARSNWVTRGFLEEVKPPLRCETNRFTVKSTTGVEVKREIANSMYDCWDMLGRGEQQFIGNSMLQTLGIAQKKSVCLICSTFDFSKATQKKVLHIEGFNEYLTETKIPTKEVTYSTFFTGKENSKIEIFDPQVSSDKWSTDKQYSILYMHIKGTSAFEIFRSVITFDIWRTHVAFKNMLSSAKLCKRSIWGCSYLTLGPHDQAFLNDFCHDLKSLP